MVNMILNVLGEEGQSIPLIVDSPHSGVVYPSDFKHQAEFSKLRQAEDSYVDELYNYVSEIGGVILNANFPRSYIDPNRAETDFPIEELIDVEVKEEKILFNPTIKSELGIGLIWLRIPPNGEPMYANKIKFSEFIHRVKKYHRPYHKTLKEIMSSTYQNFGKFYHINAHSMQNKATAMSDQEKGTRRPDFVIGDRDGTSCKREFTDLIVDFLRSLNYSVDINDPYKGMELVDAYSDPEIKKNSVQIEVNRRLYMDEITRIKSDNFDLLKTNIGSLLNEIKLQIEKGIL